jgi:uncharacterized protein YpiB (UPF0302 family)
MKLLRVIVLPFTLLLFFASTAIAASEKPAYVQRFFAKHSWKVFEACQVVGYVDGEREVDVRRVKEKDVFVSQIPSSARSLVVEAMTSPESIFKEFGGRRFRMDAELKSGVSYRMNLVRDGQNILVWISDLEGKAVSQRLSFDIEHPFIKPPTVLFIP